MKTLFARWATCIMLLGVLVPATLMPVSATNPYDWFTYNHTDVLNFQTYGSWGGYWNVSNVMGGVGWGDPGYVNTEYAAVVPWAYVPQDNALARGDLFCGGYECRNHTRMWGLPYRNSTEAIQSVSKEHWPGGFATAHIVDSYNDGRDSLFWDLYPSPWVHSGYWAQQYQSNCIRQPNGTCAPYDGQVAYQDIESTPCCGYAAARTPANAPANATQVPSSQAVHNGHGAVVKPAGDKEAHIVLPASTPPPGALDNAARGPAIETAPTKK